MLTEIYIEALLVYEELPDQLWEAWDNGEISDFWAAWGWWLIASNAKQSDQSLLRLGHDNENATMGRATP